MGKGNFMEWIGLGIREKYDIKVLRSFFDSVFICSLGCFCLKRDFLYPARSWQMAMIPG